MIVADVMSKKVHVAKFDTTAAEAAKLMRDHDCGVLPVERDGKLIGMITDRDIAMRCCAEKREPAKTRVEEVMTDRVYHCNDKAELEKVAANMGEMQIRRLPVVDDDKRLVGIVSLGDISARGNINMTDAAGAVSAAAN